MYMLYVKLDWIAHTVAQGDKVDPIYTWFIIVGDPRYPR